MSLLGYRRHTPTSSAALQSTAPAPLLDGRAAIGRLRALATLVSRLAVVGGGRAIMEARPEQQQAVREAVRDFASRMREDGMQCRLIDGQFVLAGAPLPREIAQGDPDLRDFLSRCLALSVGGIAIRQGASPGELLMLATTLVRPRTPPTGVPAVPAAGGERNPPRELLRSWSVVVTAGDVVSTTRRPSFADGLAALTAEGDPEGSRAATVLGALATAKSTKATERVATALIAVVDLALARGDAAVLDGIVRSTIAHLHVVGDGPGRLAMERVLRSLQRRPILELIARQLPRATDRTPLLELLARAGDVSVELLVSLLMDAEDPPSRRAYFDSIVALDLGGTRVVALLRDPRWFVVRNAIALLGDMGVEPADEVLLPYMQHQDDRLRVAAARTLLRLGTPKAMQQLHGAIDDRLPEIRRLSATSYALAGSMGIRAPAVRLAAAFEREMEEDVALEMLAALGRLGSADAVQRLLRIALPPQSSDIEAGAAMRESYLRIAALEALVKARGGAAQVAIDQLLKDPDPEVAAAAQRLRG